MLSSESSYYREAAREFNAALASQAPDLTIRQVLTDDAHNSLSANPDFILAIGSKAAIKLAELEPESAVLNILLPRATHHKIARQAAEKKDLSAIYLDQPEQRLANLTLMLPLEIKRVGSIVSTEQMANFATRLEQQFDRKQVEFTIRHMDESDKPIQILRPLFRDIDVFIALPDKPVFTRALARWILNFSLQQSIPVIGFSAAYAEAGALVSIYSTPNHIGRQAANVFSKWTESDTLPPPSGIPPQYFAVRVNLAVARKMDLNTGLLNDSALQSQLEALEASRE